MTRQAALKTPGQTTQKASPRAAPRAQRRAVEVVRGGGAAAPVQAKLEVHESDDEFEREADAVADQVLGMPAGEGEEAGGSLSSLPKLQVQREEDGDPSVLAEELEKEEEPDTEALQVPEFSAEPPSGEAVQAKVEPGALEEAEDTGLQREVDASSEEGAPEDLSVQRKAEEIPEELEDTSVQRASEEFAEDTSVQRASEGPAEELAEAMDEESRVQLRADWASPASALESASSSSSTEESEEIQREMDDELPLESMDPGALQRASDSSAEGDEGDDEVQAAGRRPRDPLRPPASFSGALREAKHGGGRELPRDVREFMEVRFGRSFAGVRVHTDERAHALTRQVHARAFTTGAHIFFKRGEFQPRNPGGRHLLAHELTHVVQQGMGMRTGAVQRQLVQRGAEVVQREADEGAPVAIAASTAWTSVDSLLEFFGLRSQDVPPGHWERIREMLDRALRREPWKLEALVDEGSTAESVQTKLRAGEYELTLEACRKKQLTLAKWKLEQGPDSHPHLVLEGESPRFHEPRELETHREQSFKLEVGLLPRADSNAAELEAVERQSQREAGGLAEEIERDAAEAGTSASPDRTPAESTLEIASSSAQSTGGPGDLVEGLQADQAAEEAQREEVEKEPRIDPSEGAGQSAGEDDPSEVRLPVDEQEGPEVAPEEEIASPRGEEGETAQREQDQASGSAASPAAPASWTGRAVAAARRVGGHPLAVSARQRLEARFGTSFAEVRVHTDRRAHELARALRATAFTVGRDIFFAYGRYAPDSPEGRRLLIHELTHVVQQRLGLVGEESIQRHGDEACPPPDLVPEVEVVRSPSSSSEDPEFGEMTTRADNRAANQERHESAEKKSVEANSAAEVKPGEMESLAQAAQVEKIAAEASQPPGFDKEGFIQAVLVEVAKAAPKTLDEADNFVARGKVKAVQRAVTDNAQAEAAASTEPLEQVNEQAPDTSAVTQRQPTPLQVEPAGAEPGSIRADRAMPPARTRSEVDISASAIEANNILKENCITREYMDQHGDPELQGAAAAQDELQEHVEQAPAAFREEEAGVLEGARGEASATGQTGVAALFEERTKNFAEVGDKQENAKSDNEQKREEAAQAVDQIFTETKTKVDARLGKIDTDALAKFDEGSSAAVSRYEQDSKRRLEAYKKQRYSGRPDLWVRDLFLPLPPEVNAIYLAARDAFIADMRVVIGEVADVVGKGLEEAQQLVESGKEQVQTKLDSLGSELDDFKAQVTSEMDGKFADLSRQIRSKEQSLVGELAKRYAAALERVNELEQSLRDENRSLSERAESAFNSAVELVGGEIAKLAALVGEAAPRIVRDPLTFLKNLGAGIVGGFEMFAGNIGTNIQGAVVEWLTGNLSKGGIQLPASFDLKGIVGFLLDLVGLGVAGIKNIARKVFGAPAMALIEKGVEGAEQIKQIFDILSAEGPGGLLKYLQGEFAQMKEKVLGEVGAALAESLVVAGIKKVVGLLSGLVTGGAGTVVTIVSTIIDVILWVKNNAAQLSELVSTVAGMAMAVLNGQVGAVSSAVNDVLKRLLPVVLGFLGAMVGIGSAIDKIRKIFKSIGEPAKKAIRGLFLRLKKLVQGLLKKVKGKKKGDEKGMSPERIVREVAAQLSQPTKSGEPAKAIAEKKAQASALKSKYQPRAPKGRTLKITLDESLKGAQEDRDVDFSVGMSPEEKGAAPLARGGLDTSRAEKEKQEATGDAKKLSKEAAAGKAAQEKGRQFELRVAQEIIAEIRAKGGMAISQSNASGGGFDVVAHMPDGSIVIHEIKAGKPVAFKTRGKGKGVKAPIIVAEDGNTAENFDETSGQLKKGRGAGRVLRESTQDGRTSLVGQIVGGKEFVSSTGRSVENKVSAFTANLGQNLRDLAQELSRLAQTAESSDDKQKLNAFQKAVEALLSGEQAKLKIVLESPLPPSDNELETIRLLAEAAAKGLGTVDFGGIEKSTRK